MRKLKVGIVEDDLIISCSLKASLQIMGYDVYGPSASYSEAVKMITQDKPDILLIDIHLNGKKTGIDVARFVDEGHYLPYLFLSSDCCSSTIENAKKVRPQTYLIKPCSNEELYASIEITFSNFCKNLLKSMQNKPVVRHRNAIFIKEKSSFVKILYDDIIFIESNENYVKVSTSCGKKYLVRSTFSYFLEQLPIELFCRIDRRYAVQLASVDKVEANSLLIGQHKIPLCKSYRDDLYRQLGINN